MAATAVAVVILAVLGFAGWRFGWWRYGAFEGEPPIVVPSPTNTPLATVPPKPSVPEAAVPPYTGIPVATLHADPGMVAAVSPATYQASKKELADLATELAVEPDQPALWKRVAYIKHFYNDHLGARDAYEYVNRIAPTDSVAFYNLAVLYGYDLKEPERAKQKFETALRLSAFDVSFYVGFANFYREVMYDTAAAERVLLDGFAKVPTDVGITSTLGMLYRDVGNVAKAIEFYEKTLAAKDLSSGERAAIQAEVDRLRAKL